MLADTLLTPVLCTLFFRKLFCKLSDYTYNNREFGKSKSALEKISIFFEACDWNTLQSLLSFKVELNAFSRNGYDLDLICNIFVPHSMGMEPLTYQQGFFFFFLARMLVFPSPHHLYRTTNILQIMLQQTS